MEVGYDSIAGQLVANLVDYAPGLGGGFFVGDHDDGGFVVTNRGCFQVDDEYSFSARVCSPLSVGSLEDFMVELARVADEYKVYMTSWMLKRREELWESGMAKSGLAVGVS